MTAPRLAISIAAKVNLHLQIIGRRPDGYHEVRTLMQSIDLFDRLTAERAPAGELFLEIEPAGMVTTGADNLVLRAARALAEATGVAQGARFELTKKIPVGAGLGGGSADVVAALMLLERLWGLDGDPVLRHRLGSELGSDVPFFLHGGLAVAVGRGDEVYPLPDLPASTVLVAGPGLRLSTAEVFRRFRSRLTWERHEATVYAFAAGLREQLDWRQMFNDLEETVIGGWPEVGRGLGVIRAARPLHATLSGSGSACCAVFRDRAAACRAAADLPEGWWAHVGTTVPRRDARPEIAVENGQEGKR
jgi:4-diphosphocytidyl-2-C-methyl-D-erythritol kinase